MNPILVVEETQQPTPEDMDVDMMATKQKTQNQGIGTLKEVQLENVEATLRVNGMMTNQEEEFKPY